MTGTAPLAQQRAELVERIARHFVRARGAELIASDEKWPRAVSDYRAICAEWPNYTEVRSLINDAFRDADQALAAIHDAGMAVVEREVPASILGEALPLIEAEPSPADKRLGATACLFCTGNINVPNEGDVVIVAAQLAGDYRRLVAAADLAPIPQETENGR